MNVYEIVTNKIIEKLEAGVIPWRRPWTNKPAVNFVSQKPYRGVNALLLDSGEYATFNQIKAAGGNVKKGEKSNLVVFWKMLDGKDDEGKPTKIPFLRYYKVFEIGQCEGLESRRKDAEPHNHSPIEMAEEIRKGYLNGPQVTFSPGQAFYRPSTDVVSIPEIHEFSKAEEFYSTLFHELVHSTGHKSRLNRSGITEANVFGSENYSKEELVAEIGSAMLCSIAKIEHATLDNQAAYISAWLRRLREDSKLIVSAASQAQKAADHILGGGVQDDRN